MENNEVSFHIILFFPLYHQGIYIKRSSWWGETTTLYLSAFLKQVYIEMPYLGSPWKAVYEHRIGTDVAFKDHYSHSTWKYGWANEKLTIAMGKS